MLYCIQSDSQQQQNKNKVQNIFISISFYTQPVPKTCAIKQIGETQWNMQKYLGVVLISAFLFRKATFFFVMICGLYHSFFRLDVKFAVIYIFRRADKSSQPEQKILIQQSRPKYEHFISNLNLSVIMKRNIKYTVKGIDKETTLDQQTIFEINVYMMLQEI